MAISEAPANVAVNAMQSIPFNSMIGGPLKACIEAQAMAAQTSWEFIQNVGLNTDPETGEKKAVNVSFSFNQGGRMVQLNVPLLTIVPIPYIAIHTIDINFKANISASSSSIKENSKSESTDAGGTAKAKLNLGIFKVEADLKANYSSKKDSKATEESKYSVESTERKPITKPCITQLRKFVRAFGGGGKGFCNDVVQLAVLQHLHSRRSGSALGGNARDELI